MFLLIIIPAINESDRIQRAITSAWDVGAQEVFVVDGGSQDDTIRLSEQAGALVVQAPRGRALQQNRGAEVARGDVLLFLHADNWLDPAAGEQLRTAIANPTVRCGAFRQQIDAPDQIFRWLEWGNSLRAGRLGMPYGDQGIFVRRDLFASVGGFPPIPLMEDVELMRRLRRISRPVLLPGPLHVDARRWQRQGVLRQTTRNWLLLAAYRLGVPPARLARAYRPHDGVPPADERG